VIAEKSEDASCILAFLIAGGTELLNVPQIFDNFGARCCQIVESFVAFDNIGPNWYQIVEST